MHHPLGEVRTIIYNYGLLRRLTLPQMIVIVLIPNEKTKAREK